MEDIGKLRRKIGPPAGGDCEPLRRILDFAILPEIGNSELIDQIVVPAAASGS